MKLPWTCPHCYYANFHYRGICARCDGDRTPPPTLDERLAKLLAQIEAHAGAPRRDRVRISIDIELAAQLAAEARGRARRAALDWWLATRSAPPVRTARHVAEEQWAAAWARHDALQQPRDLDAGGDQRPPGGDAKP